jgi:hypothetical protein
VYLGLTYCTIRQFHRGDTLLFPPTTAIVQPLQMPPDMHHLARGYGLDVPDFAEDLESRADALFSRIADHHLFLRGVVFRFFALPLAWRDCLVDSACFQKSS